MKPILHFLFLNLIFFSAFSQSIQNTVWKTYSVLLFDTVTVEIKIDTVHQYFVGTDSLIVSSLFKEYNDTVSIVDVAGPWMCPNPDTGWYILNIVGDTMEIIAVADPCSQRGSNLHGSILWKAGSLSPVASFDVRASTLKVYPNPSQGMVSISTEQSGLIKIYTSTGQLLYKKESDFSHTDFTINLRPGSYIVIHQNSKSVVSKKLLVY